MRARIRPPSTLVSASHGHARAEVAAADADVEHGVEPSRRWRRLQRPGMHLLDERPHVRQLVGDQFRRRVVDAARQRSLHARPAPWRAQRHVHRGPALGRVDHLAGKQPLAEPVEVGRVSQRQQRVECGVVDRVLRIIEREVVEMERPPMRPVRIGREQRADRRRLGPPAKFHHARPRGFARRDHGVGHRRGSWQGRGSNAATYSGCAVSAKRVVL